MASGNRGTIREYNEFDANGELISSTITKRPRKLQGRWFFVHSTKVNEYLLKQTSLVKVKILMLIASKMTMASPLVKATKTALAMRSNASTKQVWQAVKDLEADGILIEVKDDGQTGFLINPNFISLGSATRDLHLRLWKEYTDDGHRQLTKKTIDKETGEVL